MKPEELYNLSQETERSDTHNQAKKESTLMHRKEKKTRLQAKKATQKVPGIQKGKKSQQRQEKLIPVIVLFKVAYADSLSTTSHGKFIFCT